MGIAMDRRQFLSAALGAAAKPPDSSENLVTTLYQSLSEEQRQTVVLPFDHPLRSKVDNNWFVTPARVGRFFNADQQAMIREIFRGLYCPEFTAEAERQIQEDGAGLKNYSVGLFGEPGKGKFEFVLTGRHCTVRCDGDSVEGAAFGGPIFYGHQAGPNDEEKPDHPNNAYWYQARRANEVFQALDGRQRKLALIPVSRQERGEATSHLRTQEVIEGLPVSDMSRDQRELVSKVLGDLLAPFRVRDVAEVMQILERNGGVGGLKMAFFENHDIGSDGVWDIWQLESKNVLWYFRGAPHVHVWVNVKG